MRVRVCRHMWWDSIVSLLYSLVKCPLGTYQFSTNCLFCSLGQYQPLEGQQSCLTCPTVDQSTKHLGSKSLENCVGNWEYTKITTAIKSHYFVTRLENVYRMCFLLDRCRLGTYSRDGLRPCTTCKIGFYQESRGSLVCHKCPHHTATWRRGAQRLSDCRRRHFVVYPLSTILRVTIQWRKERLKSHSI